MAHLFTGLVLGLILWKIFHNKNIIFFCAVGSVLPDLVRILFEYLLTGSALKNARIVSGPLGLFLLFLVTGFIVWFSFRSNAFLCVAAGLFLHRIQDSVANPNWRFPLLGQYFDTFYHGPYHATIRLEIASVSEWIFFIAIVGILICMMTKISLSDLQTGPGREKELVNGILGITFIIFILIVSVVFFLQPVTAFFVHGVL